MESQRVLSVDMVFICTSSLYQVLIGDYSGGLLFITSGYVPVSTDVRQKSVSTSDVNKNRDIIKFFILHSVSDSWTSLAITIPIEKGSGSIATDFHFENGSRFFIFNRDHDPD